MLISSDNYRAVRAQLVRLGAWGPTGIECEDGPERDTIAVYDTAVCSVYRAEDVIRALTDADAEGWPGGGFEAAWQALGALETVTASSDADPTG
jgi:hypothetical protein